MDTIGEFSPDAATRGDPSGSTPNVGAPVCVGVDVGGTRLRVVARDALGRRSEVREVPVPRVAGELVRVVASLATELTGGNAITRTAIGLPGQTSQRVPTWIPNLRLLDGFQLAQAVEGELGGECVLLNDAQATLVAEQREGVVVGCSSAILVAVGTGIGGAVMIDGRIVRGVRGCAGSFGWLPMGTGVIEPDHGEWEQVASGAALDRLGEPWGGAAALVEAARNGERDAMSVIDRFGGLLGRGTAGLASVFDPQFIVLAGGVSGALDVLGPSMRRAHAAHASPAGRDVPLVGALLGSRAGVFGALHVALSIQETS